MDVTFADDREPHWIRSNHQCRIPARWISFDTESKGEKGYGEQVQEWTSGAAITWRRDLKSSDARSDYTFRTSIATLEVTSPCDRCTRCPLLYLFAITLFTFRLGVE